MTPDDDMVMAYADGELDPIATKRVERAMADDPALAEAIEAHRALRRRVGAAFAPVHDEAVPDHLTAMLASNVVPLNARPTPATSPRRWLSGLAIAASLVVGVALGSQWQRAPGPVSTTGGALVASGDLAHALDTQLASAAGDTQIRASFRDGSGSFCRVFSTPALDGIACKGGNGWQLRQTQQSGVKRDTAYRQTASESAWLMSAAQGMMVGDPLDAEGEERARAAGWTAAQR